MPQLTELTSRINNSHLPDFSDCDLSHHRLQTVHLDTLNIGGPYSLARFVDHLIPSLLFVSMAGDIDSDEYYEDSWLHIERLSVQIML